MPYPTCRHIKEDGHICQSPAIHRSHYCYFHDNHRARRMKIAQARARGERIWIDLPPLEDMCAVQSAVAQVAEAIAAGVIELKRARALMTALRLAANNFRTVKAWRGHPYELDESHERVASYPGLALEYGLPPKTDLDAHPEEVFPPAKAKPGAPPMARFAGHKRSAVGCRTTPGIIDSCKRMTSEDQLFVLREMANAFAEGMGKKPPIAAASSQLRTDQSQAAGSSGASGGA